MLVCPQYALLNCSAPQPNFLVKVIPKPDMTGPDVLELVQYGGGLMMRHSRR